MSGLSDERPSEALCASVPRLDQQRGAVLHPPGGPAEWPEETFHHGLQDGGQVGLFSSRGPDLINFYLAERTGAQRKCAFK